MKATFLLTAGDFREGFDAYRKSYSSYAACVPGSPLARHIVVTTPTSAQARRKTLMLTAFPFVLVTAVVIGMFSISLTHESKADPADVGAVWHERFLRFGFPLVVLVLVIGTVLYSRRRVQKSTQANMEAQQECTLEVFESGLRIAQTAAVYTHLWSAFRILAEAENVFVLQLTESTYLIIPKRAFAGAAEIEAFRAMVVEKLTPPANENDSKSSQPAVQSVPIPSAARFAFRVQLTFKESREAMKANEKVRKMGPLTTPASDLHAPPILDLTKMNRTHWLSFLWKYYWIPLVGSLVLWQVIQTILTGGLAALWKRLGAISVTSYVIAGAVAGFVFYMFLGVRKQMKIQIAKLPEERYEVREGGIQVASTSTIYFEWFALKRAVETPALLMIYSEENTSMIIPKRCFSDALELNAFRELLATKIGNRALGAFPVEAVEPANGPASGVPGEFGKI